MKMISLALCVLCATYLQAQVTDYTFSKESGQISELSWLNDSLVTNHIVNDDEVLPSKIAVTFPFMFNGKAYDSIGISENGFIWFGSETAATMADVINPITAVYSSNVKGVISALGADLHPQVNTGLTTTIKTAVIGTAPMRELIIEWKNTSRFDAVTDAMGEDTILFQIKLYEFVNRVEIAYGSFKLNTNISNDIEVGLRGLVATDFNTRATDATHNWTNSIAGVLNTDVCVLDKNTLPEYGDLFVWMNLNQHPTGVKTPAKNLQANVYPNPTNGKLFFETENTDARNIVITNVAGQQLFTVNCNNITTTALDLAAYENGIYFYQIKDATNALIANGKFVLTK